MSPKSESTASSRRQSPRSPPYPQPAPASSASRRSSNKPKSARQQFSACGACRMRRVRCDLKDLQASSPDGQQVACSNCSERGLKCVDEFAPVKAAKLLRRGRRLQQVEMVYGRVADDADSPYNVFAGSNTGSSGSCSVIPKLKPEFFSSPFFRRFLIQRPILEPTEFSTRFFDFLKGNKDALTIPGQIIAMLLVVWAASFGVDEAGDATDPESSSTSFNYPPPPPTSSDSSVSPGPECDSFSGAGTGPGFGCYEALRRRKERTNKMVLEVLRLVDLHGILRKPSWDGVRVVLLVLPLTVDVQSPIERITMYETAINQIYTLCSFAPTASPNSGQGEYIDALVRARIFWYAYTHEGVTTSLRGGRLLLSEDDLNSFQLTLPPLPLPPMSTASSPNSPMNTPPRLTRPSLTYAGTYRYASIPIRISTACRLVHAALTGPKARQRGDVDEAGLSEAWETLANAWEELDSLLGVGDRSGMGLYSSEEVNKFVGGWQIAIFRCYNNIREALKQCISAQPAPQLGDPLFGTDRVSQLYEMATQKCHMCVRQVVSIVRTNLGTSFFEFDAALARDGCFFAAYLLAGEDRSEEDVEFCLRALREMRWAFCKSEEREQTVRLVWEQRRARRPRASPEDAFVAHSRSSVYGSSPTFLPKGVQNYRLLPPVLRVPIGSEQHVQGVESCLPTATTEDGTWLPDHRSTTMSNGSRGSDGSLSPDLSGNGGPSPPYFSPTAESFVAGANGFLEAAHGSGGAAAADAYFSKPPVGSQSYYATPDVAQYDFVASNAAAVLRSPVHSGMAALPASAAMDASGVVYGYDTKAFSTSAASVYTQWQ